MKIFILMLLLISTVASANTMASAKCSRQSCVFNADQEYGFYEVESRSGESYLKLNTKASLLDLPFEGMCFTGDKKEVLSIVEALAGNTDENAFNGGHFRVVGLYARKLQEKIIVVDVTIMSDYRYNLYEQRLVLEGCK